MPAENRFCAIGFSHSSVACFQRELRCCTCRDRVTGPARCEVVIFDRIVAIDSAYVFLIRLCF